MKYIISYDISKSYIRKQVSDFLLSNNFIRIQKSIFLGEINSQFLSEKTSILKSFLNDKSDSILICPLCFNDLKKSYFLGKTFNLNNLEQSENFILF